MRRLQVQTSVYLEFLELDSHVVIEQAETTVGEKLDFLVILVAELVEFLALLAVDHDELVQRIHCDPAVGPERHSLDPVAPHDLEYLK
jgi:hypothetical protein